MEERGLIGIINKGISKYPKIATITVTTTVLSLAIAGYVLGDVKKAKSNTSLSKIESTTDENTITIQELNNCHLARFHNELTDVDNYKFVIERENSVFNVLNNEKLFDLSNNDKVVTYSKLGSIDDYLLSYDLINSKYNKIELENLLDRISNDIEEKNKELVK